MRPDRDSTVASAGSTTPLRRILTNREALVGVIAYSTIVLGLAGSVMFVAWAWPADDKFRGERALFQVTRRVDLDATRAAIGRGANLDAEDSEGWNPLMVASQGARPRLAGPSRDDPVDLVALLIEAGSKVDSPSTSGLTPLILASRAGHAKTVALLLDRGADPTARDLSGRTALDWAIELRRRDVITLLRTAGSARKVSTIPRP